MNDINILIEEVRQTQQEALRQANLLPKVKAGVMAAELRRGTRYMRALWITTALTGAVAAALVFTRPAPLSVAVGEAGVKSGAGAVVEAPATAPLPVRFSDGTELALAPRARLGVAAVDSHGATLVLERGSLDVGVVHRRGARWAVRAGRFEVAVTGTRFAVSFDPGSDALTVEMRAGSVLVRGPGRAAATPLVAGQTLHADGRTGHYEVTAGAPGEVAAAPPDVESGRAQPEAPAPLEAPPAAEGAPAAATAPALTLPAPGAHPAPLLRASHVVDRRDRAWIDLANASRYREALAAAERVGFSSLCVRLDPHDLVLLGDTARLANNADRAEQAYIEAGRRSPRLDRTVYGLGLVEADLRHRYHSAAEWFSQYIESYPRGRLASEAAGRLIETWQLAGEPDRARKAARDYLTKYPTGPHAALARQLSGS